MSKIDELRRQIASYHEVLSLIRGPYKSAEDEVAERLISRLLDETSEQLKVMERGMVKLHRGMDSVAIDAIRFDMGMAETAGVLPRSAKRANLQ